MRRVFSQRGREAANGETSGANWEVAQPGKVIDFDCHGRRFLFEELFIDVEEDFVIPGGVGVALVVDFRGEFVVRVDVGDGEGSKHFGDGRKVVGGDDVDFELEGRLGRHGGRECLRPPGDRRQLGREEGEKGSKGLNEGWRMERLATK